MLFIACSQYLLAEIVSDKIRYNGRYRQYRQDFDGKTRIKFTIYDKDGHYLKTYVSLLEIHKLYPNFKKTINRVVRVEHEIFYGGYLWKLDNGDHDDIKSYTPYKGKAIIQICPDTGEILGRYRSIREATEQTGINNIGAVLTGKRTQAGGFHWQYEIG